MNVRNYSNLRIKEGSRGGEREEKKGKGWREREEKRFRRRRGRERGEREPAAA